MKGKLVILSGPSGVGKDTVIDAWHKVNPAVERVVACTTRDPRPDEVTGVDYTFLTNEKFEQEVAEGFFLEHKKVHDFYYGTPLKSLEKMLAEGKIAILKIDVQGAMDVIAIRPDAVSIFLLPPSTEELEKRIRGRGTDSDAVIQKRLTNASFELSFSHRYQHRIVNQELPQVIAQLQSILMQAAST